MTLPISRTVLRLVLITSMLLCCVYGCSKERLDEEAWVARGQAALKPFKQQLMGALIEGLQDGPIGAIDVCRVEAPRIAREVSTPGVRMGRTSHRLRNEANAPGKWMQPLLEGYVNAPGRSGPQVVRLGAGGVGYVEPILVKSPCLACHGSDLDPALAVRIDANYPEDKARGFREGDFRGLFWVEFDKVK